MSFSVLISLQTAIIILADIKFHKLSMYYLDKKVKSLNAVHYSNVSKYLVVL